MSNQKISVHFLLINIPISRSFQPNIDDAWLHCSWRKIIFANSCRSIFLDLVLKIGASTLFNTRQKAPRIEKARRPSFQNSVQKGAMRHEQCNHASSIFGWKLREQWMYIKRKWTEKFRFDTGMFNLHVSVFYTYQTFSIVLFCKCRSYW
jgi:hypothetical protein